VGDKAGAACVDSIHSDYSRTSVSTNVPVSIVQLPKPVKWNACGTTVLGDAGSVGFVVGESTFRDHGSATTTLTTLAGQLAGNEDQATLTGSTSSEGSPAANQVLSVQRAQAVANVLEGLGVAPSRITVQGVGSTGPNHIQDMTPQGVLIPSAAEHNRSVTVTVYCAAG
jgi:outer membrane protein OmpA-like peptidoglycan-associated protein